MGLETIAIATLGAVGGAVAAKSLSGGSPKMPSVKAEQDKRTAAPVDKSSEAFKRKLFNVAFQGRGFAPPKLGQAGLLGA